MPHECDKEKVIRDMEIRLAVAESDVKNVKDDIKQVKSDIKEVKGSVKETNKLITTKFDAQQKWLIGLLITIIGTLITFVVKG